MKILILGSTGMAGHLITIYFKEQGYDVTAFSVSHFPYCNNIIGNALDYNNFKDTLLTGEYDVVINCIGLLNQAAERDSSMAVYLNSYLPHMISDLFRGEKTKLIHMSTDCVFKGNSGPYFEDSLRDGLSFYDRTKALGEVQDDRNLTFRNSIVGPDMNENGIGLFNWFMKQRNPIHGYTNAIWTGVSTLTLAKAMDQAIKENLCGLYNLVNNASISKFDLLCLFNKYFWNNSLTINALDNFKLDKTLFHKRNDFSFVVPPYEEMISEMKDWVYLHKYLYPKYYFKF